MDERVRADERAPQRDVVHRRLHDAHEPAIGIQLARRRPQQSDVRRALEERSLIREPLGQRDVIRVQTRHERRPREAEGTVEGTCESRALLAHDAQPWIADRSEQVRRGVGGAVVDDDQLEIAGRLAQHAGDGLGHRRRAVVYRHQHGDGGGHW